MDQEKIGKFIQECRKEKNITQQQLAYRLGVSDRTIGNWENGRNMPDLSLFKPLCEELNISINDLLSGEKLKEQNYKEIVEENTINTINYCDYKLNKNNYNLGFILIIIGILINISSFIIFERGNILVSIYPILGLIISFLGFIKFTKKLSYYKKILLNASYIIIFLIITILVDYIYVVTNKQMPMFFYIKEKEPNYIVYKTIFYDVYKINFDTVNEYIIVDTKKKYNANNLPISPFNKDKSGIDNIIKYKALKIDDNINNLIDCLPLSEYNNKINIDYKNSGITINYYLNDWFINQNKYLEKSLIYNSISLFILIDNLEYININFADQIYKINKEAVINNFGNYKDIVKNEIDKYNFDLYLERQLSNSEYVDHLFQTLFINENIIKTNKIIVDKGNKEKVITNINDINEIINLMKRATKINGAVTLEGSSFNIYMYHDNELIYKFLGWRYNGYSISFGLDAKEYMLIGLDGERFEDLINGF